MEVCTFWVFMFLVVIFKLVVLLVLLFKWKDITPLYVLKSIFLDSDIQCFNPTAVLLHVSIGIKCGFFCFFYCTVHWDFYVYEKLYKV